MRLFSSTPWLALAIFAPASFDAHRAAADSPSQALMAPLRISFGGQVEAPLKGRYVLGEAVASVDYQIGWANLNPDTTGSGFWVGIGSRAGFGTYQGPSGDVSCEEETVNEEGETTTSNKCGHLGLGGTISVGWSKGVLADTGVLIQDHTIRLRFGPGIVLSNNPERGVAEMTLQGAIGYMGSFYGIEAVWTRSPNDDYIGCAFLLSKAFSAMLARDKPVDPNQVELPGKWVASRPIMILVGLGALAEHEESWSVYSAVPLSAHWLWGQRSRWWGVGGELIFAQHSSRQQTLSEVGPSIAAGFGPVHSRITPLLGWRNSAAADEFDWGVGAAVGLTAPIDRDNDVRFGLEATGLWLDRRELLGLNLVLVVNSL